MGKNSFLHSKVLRTNVAMLAVIAMLLGFFASRAMLSISMMLFGLNGLLGVHPRRWLSQTWWLIGASWVGLYLLSGLWSTNMDYWYTRCEVKLPVLLLPLAFAFTPVFGYRQQRLFTVALNLVLLSGVVYSLSFLVRDAEFYIKGYDYSNVLPTLPKGDHIVFSLSMALAVVWNVYFHRYIRERWLKWFAAASVIIFAVMLHVLAARTGLAALYIFIACWCIYLALRKKTRVYGIVLIVCFAAGALLSVRYIPTLRNKLDHLNYTMVMFREGNMSGDYSDIGRYMSYDIGLRLIKEHPLKGVGAGEILDSMKGGYDRWYPHVPDEQRLIPHNQFLTVAVACGLPAMLLFIAWVFYPLTRIRRDRHGFFFVVVWSIMMVPLMVEPVLEIQFGVFVYLFFVLWQWHAGRQAPADEPDPQKNKASEA